jgi:hypothetical protein
LYFTFLRFLNGSEEGERGKEESSLGKQTHAVGHTPTKPKVDFKVVVEQFEINFVCLCGG